MSVRKNVESLAKSNSQILINFQFVTEAMSQLFFLWSNVFAQTEGRVTRGFF